MRFPVLLALALALSMRVESRVPGGIIVADPSGGVWTYHLPIGATNPNLYPKGSFESQEDL